MENWIRIDPISGTSGVNIVSIEADENTGAERNTQLTVTASRNGEHIEEYISVLQRRGISMTHLTTRSMADNNSITMKLNSGNSDYHVAYSTDNGETWHSFSRSGSIQLITVSADTGDEILWKGNITTSDDLSGGDRFYATGSFEVLGNIMSLVLGDSFTGSTAQTFNFSDLFHGSTTLINAENLILPDYLSDYCYYGMFMGCTNLETAPVLPATDFNKLACYRDIFYDCSKLDYIECLVESGFSSFNGDGAQGWLNGVANKGMVVISGNATVSTGTTSNTGFIMRNYFWNSGFTSIPLGWEVYSNDKIIVSKPTMYMDKDGDTEYLNVLSPYKWTASVMAQGISLSQYSGNPGTTKISVTKSSAYTGNNDKIVFYSKTLSKEVKISYYDQSLTGSYLTTESISDGNSITFTIPSSVTSSISTSISYSTDNGATWNTTNVTSSAQTITVSGLSTGDKVLWKGEAYAWASAHSGSTSSKFSATGNYKVYGNVLSILGGDSFTEIQLTRNYAIANLFFSSTTLTDASGLILPEARTNYCFTQMFAGCTSLVNPPGVIKGSSPNSSRFMFWKCSSLENAPKLEETSVETYSYYYMFQECVSLITAPELPARDVYTYSYYGMFFGCQNLESVPLIDADILWDYSMAYMLKGCTSLKYVCCNTVIDINDTYSTYSWIGDGNRDYTFSGNPVFVKNPEVQPVYETPDDSYQHYWWPRHYHGISPGFLIHNSETPSSGYLTTIMQGSGDIMLSGKSTNYGYFFYSTDNGSTWECKEATSVNWTGVTISGLSSGASVLWKGLGKYMWDNNNHRFSFSSTTDYAVSGNIMSMLVGSKFNDTPKSPNIGRLFAENTGLTQASGLTLSIYTSTSAYTSMFSGCTRLTGAPILQAPELTNSCYENMFNGCSSLSAITCLATSGINTNNSTTDWVSSVSGSGTFTKASSASWPTGTNGIPSGWTVQDAT